MNERILIAGIGNIFLGDDAFGCEVAQQLAKRALPDGVIVRDFGIRGLDLTYTLLENWEAAILIDAAPRGYEVGTLFLIEPDPVAAAQSSADLAPGDLLIDSHGMDPLRVLRLVATLGGNLKQLYLVGCEPKPIASEEDMEMSMSEPVARAVDEAASMIESLIAKLRGNETAGVCSDPVNVLTQGEVNHGHVSPAS